MEKQKKEIAIQIIDAYPKRSKTLPDIKGPKKYPIAKHCDKSARAYPFLFEGAILKTISVEVGRKEDVPKLIKIIAMNTK